MSEQTENLPKTIDNICLVVFNFNRHYNMFTNNPSLNAIIKVN